MALFAQAARLIARSTGLVGYRGVGRVFRPLSGVSVLQKVEGEARLGETRRIRFGAFDYYWAGFLWTGRAYEPDVQQVFDRLARIPNKVFLDGGANIGYWTVKLSERRYGYERLIAVEANPAVFAYLERNMSLNQINGVAIQAAIAARDGETVYLGGSRDHASASIGAQGVPVTTVSVASLLRDHAAGVTPGATAVVKLDVEGSEVAAIEGAEGDHGLELIFVFEDWPRSGMTVVQHLLAKGYAVIGIERDGSATSITSVHEAHAFNQRTTDRYGPSNLIACRDRSKVM